MEYNVNAGAVNGSVFYVLEEIILMHVVNKLQATEISVALIFLFAIIQVIHNENISAALAIKLLDDIGADKACSAGYYYHAKSSYSDIASRRAPKSSSLLTA